VQHGVGSKFGHGGGYAGGIAQIQRQAKIAALKRREAERRAAGTHRRRHLMTRFKSDPDRGRADKTGGSGKEKSHNNACA